MSRVRLLIREWMIGWHQGHKERYERAAQRHRVAESRWRCREGWGTPRRASDYYACEGESYATPEDAQVAREVALAERHRLIESPILYRCPDGHWHLHARWAR